jgi:outer membrane lipoprotein SlyB
VKKWTIALIVVVVIAVGVGAFFGGRASKTSSTQTATLGGLAGNQTGQFPGSGRTQAGMSGANVSDLRGGFVSGSIISTDDSSITVKTADGSSKIVLISDSTKISKTEDATKSELTTGADVVVTGTSNEDGSVTATRINLGTALPAGGAPPSGTAPTAGSSQNGAASQ